MIESLWELEEDNFELEFYVDGELSIYNFETGETIIDKQRAKELYIAMKKVFEGREDE